MNLLGAILYDPGTAVAKSTASLIAMTALDTTNLRLAITVPAHGYVLIRMHTVVHGATTFPSIMLGVLDGATVRGRVSPTLGLGNTAVATARVSCDAEFTMTGLTPGAMNLDAAYAVDIVVASTNLRYGGPNDTTTDNAWGAFVFEAWDPRPIPTAAAGASGGLLISGSNSGTTTLAALTVTGALTVSDGVAITASTSNRSAFAATGNGTGHGAVFTSGSGATGDGLRAFAASTDGDGARFTGTGAGAGHRITTGATGTGLRITGGGTSGDAISTTATSGSGASFAGGGSSPGITATGGATGNGMSVTGGATSGDGLRVAANGAGSGHGINAVGIGTTRHGINATGGATTSHGIAATGGGVGNGIHATSGSGATGDGIRGTSAATNGNGLNLVGNGTGDGLLSTGGASAGGDGIAAVAGGGVDIRGAITGSVTGSLSGSVGSVTAGVTVTTNNDKSGYTLSGAGVTAVWGEVMEGSITAVQYMRGFSAALMGKASGLATTTAVYRDLGDTKDRITATVDASGNRTAVTRDLT